MISAPYFRGWNVKKYCKTRGFGQPAPQLKGWTSTPLIKGHGLPGYYFLSPVPRDWREFLRNSREFLPLRHLCDYLECSDVRPQMFLFQLFFCLWALWNGGGFLGKGQKGFHKRDPWSGRFLVISLRNYCILVVCIARPTSLAIWHRRHSHRRPNRSDIYARLIPCELKL